MATRLISSRPISYLPRSPQKRLPSLRNWDSKRRARSLARLFLSAELVSAGVSKL